MLPPLGNDDYWIGAMNSDTVGRTPTSALQVCMKHTIFSMKSVIFGLIWTEAVAF